MTTCKITTWIIQLDVGLKAAAAEILKPGWDASGWVFWCIPYVDTESESAAGRKSPLDGPDVIPSTLKAGPALELGEVMQGLIVKFSVYTRNGKFTASLGPCSSVWLLLEWKMFSLNQIGIVTSICELPFHPVPLTRVGSNASIAASHPAEDWTDLCLACCSPGKQPSPDMLLLFVHVTVVLGGHNQTQHCRGALAKAWCVMSLPPWGLTVLSHTRPVSHWDTCPFTGKLLFLSHTRKRWAQLSLLSNEALGAHPLLQGF